MHLDAVSVILLVFQWCDIIVSSLGINETETSIETITMVFPAFTHCHKQSCSKAPYPMDAGAAVTMAAPSPVQQAVAHSHSHSPGIWALLVQPQQLRDQEITPQDCQTTFDFFSHRVISFNFVSATCLNKF